MIYILLLLNHIHHYNQTSIFCAESFEFQWQFLIKTRQRSSVRHVAMAEWLRRQTRNLLGKPAQVQVLLATFFNILQL
jgi:hypothetical protein